MKNFKHNWWKILCVILIFYTITGGLIFSVPRLPILNETIRALYFHVPMWFGMIILFTISVISSIKFISSNNPKHDIIAIEFANTGIVFGILGLLTGMMWAQFTWSAAWSGDPKQNSAAIALLIYLAYIVLRNSMDDNGPITL